MLLVHHHVASFLTIPSFLFLCSHAYNIQHRVDTCKSVLYILPAGSRACRIGRDALVPTLPSDPGLTSQ